MEVHNSTLKKENELGEILRLFSIGMTKKYIREKLKLSKSNFSNYLSKLENLGNIKRIGKYKVEVLSSSLNHYKVTRNLIDKKLNKRGHAHNFKIVFQKKQDFWNNPLIKQGIAENKIETLKIKTFALNYKKYRIWINKSTLTVYSSNSYFSDNALYSKFTALRDLDNFIIYFKDKYQIKGNYGIELFREHYGLIFNKFAEWILSKGRKMDIKDKGNKSILWVDDSKDDDIGLKEFEGSNPLDVNNADKLFESHERTNWKVTPEFTIEAINKLTNNQSKQAEQISEFAIALNRHIPAYEKMGNFTEQLVKEFKSLRKELKSIKSENKSLKLKIKHQKTLFEF